MNAHTQPLVTVENQLRQLTETMQTYLAMSSSIAEKLTALEMYYQGHLYVSGRFGSQASLYGGDRLVFVGTVLGERKTATVGW